MKKKAIQSIIFIVFLLALFIPILKIAFAPSPPQLFNVMVTLGNVGPRIHNITINGQQPAFSASPTENASRRIDITFNVSDSNGQADIDTASIVATLNFTNTVRKNASACVTITTGTLDKYFNCTLIFPYFDENSTEYDLNITVADLAGVRSENYTTTAFTYTILTAIELSIYNLTFSTSPGSTDVRPVRDMVIFNRGNDVFRDLNLTTYDLNGVSQIIGASNFTFNITNTTNGGGFLIGNNSVGRTAGGNGTNYTFINGTGEIMARYVNNSNRTLFMSVNVSAELTEKSFNASQAWIIRVDRNKP